MLSPNRRNRRGPVAGTVVLVALFSFGSLPAVQAQDSPAARIARQNLPSVLTVVAVDDQDQPLGLGSSCPLKQSGSILSSYFTR